MPRQASASAVAIAATWLLAACAQAGPHIRPHTGMPVLNRPPESSPGHPVPDTQVKVPHTVTAGAMLVGQAPAGSLVEVDGRQLRVGSNGRFQARAPATGQSWTIRIVRPAPATALVIRVQVLARGG